MTDPLFIGYYTRASRYEHEADSIRVSLDALGLAHDFTGIETLGSWQKNTQAKPGVIREFIAKYPGRRLIYVDVDAYVIERPGLFWALDCDFSAVMYDANELLSGTLYILANERSAAVVNRWMDICRQFPDNLPDGRAAWDQRCLLMAINEHRKIGLKFKELPHSYCWMIGVSQKHFPDTRPIILHKDGGSAWKEKPTWECRDGKWLVVT